MAKKSKNITDVNISIENTTNLNKINTSLINKVENAERYKSKTSELKKFIVMVYVKDKTYSTVVLARNEAEAIQSFKDNNKVTPSMKLTVIEG